MKAAKALKKAKTPSQSRQQSVEQSSEGSGGSSLVGAHVKRVRRSIKKTNREGGKSAAPLKERKKGNKGASSGDSQGNDELQNRPTVGSQPNNNADAGTVKGDDARSAKHGEATGLMNVKSKPAAAKSQRKGKTGLSRKERRQREKRGVVYVGHLPMGFFEPQLRSFFSQFGEVSRVRLFRSRKNAHSKGYAFVEFALREVAEVAAQAMDKYRMFGRTLVCRLMERGEVKEHVFSKCHKPFKHINWASLAARKYNKADDQLPSAKGISAIQRRMKKKEKLLRDVGIDFELPFLRKTNEGKMHLSEWVNHEREEKKKTKKAVISARSKSRTATYASS